MLSAEHSSEDNFAVLKLAQALGVEKFYLTGRPSGEGDKILRSADKNSNRKGAKAVAEGLSLGDTKALASALEKGELTTVLALGSQTEQEVPFSRAKSLIALCTHRGPFSEAARVVLPASSWAEALGTFVNEQGLTQISQKAVSPQGDSEPAWKLALTLAAALGHDLGFAKAKEVKAAVDKASSSSHQTAPLQTPSQGAEA